jgi:hypothetical protein
MNRVTRNKAVRKQLHIVPLELSRKCTSIGKQLFPKDASSSNITLDNRDIRQLQEGIDNYYNRHLTKPGKKATLESSIFDLKALFFVVNDAEALHWFSVLVLNPGGVESKPVKGEDVVCGYVVLDPLNPNQKLEDWTGIRWLLNRAWFYKSYTPATMSKSTMEEFMTMTGPFDSAESFPQLHLSPHELVPQATGSDCGVFVCMHALSVLCTQLKKPYVREDIFEEATSKFVVPEKYGLMHMLRTVSWESKTLDEKKAHSVLLCRRFRKEFNVFLDRLGDSTERPKEDLFSTPDLLDFKDIISTATTTDPPSTTTDPPSPPTNPPSGTSPELRTVSPSHSQPPSQNDSKHGFPLPHTFREKKIH